MALANKAEAVTSGSISGRTQVDSLAYEGRLATAVDFIRRNLLQGHWRVIRPTRKFGVRAEDITRELERLGFEPSPDGRILPSTSLRFSVGSSQTGTRGHRCRAMRGRQPYRQIRLR
jgi:hypothetical protein